jgi:transcriptional regulator with XRE-family HTH domain
MKMTAFSKKLSKTQFSQVLTEKRKKAGLSLSDLADLTRLPLGFLETLESEGEIPSFDICYKIGQAINSRCMQGFMIQDLWQAATIDRSTIYLRNYATPYPVSAVNRSAIR